MNIKVACPHCQVVGVVPENLKYASDWPVACHHCHQHYYVPVVASPAPLSRQIELRCSDCGRETSFDKNIHKSTIEGKFPLFCPDCHAPLPKLQNEIVELYQTEEGYFDAKQAILIPDRLLGCERGSLSFFWVFLSSAYRSWQHMRA